MNNYVNNTNIISNNTNTTNNNTNNINTTNNISFPAQELYLKSLNNTHTNTTTNNNTNISTITTTIDQTNNKAFLSLIKSRTINKNIYKDTTNNNQTLASVKKVINLYELNRYISSLFLGQGAISNKVVLNKINKLYELRLGYYVPKNMKDPFNDNISIKYVSAQVANYLNNDIKLVVWRLHKVINDTAILGVMIGYLSINKTARVIHSAMLKSFKSYDVPLNKYATINNELKSTGFFNGFFISSAGRSFRIKLTNRRLSFNYQKGRISRETNIMVNKTRITKVNKYGTYSFTLNSYLSI